MLIYSKKDVDFRCAGIKYDLNGCFSLPKIREYMEKGNKDLSILFRHCDIRSVSIWRDKAENSIEALIDLKIKNFSKNFHLTLTYYSKQIYKSRLPGANITSHKINV